MSDIEILEENKEIFIDILYECCRQSQVKPFEKALENLIKENKELNEKNKKWEELYDEDQKYITQLNNKIFQLETDNKKLDKENQGLFEAYNFNNTNLLAKTLKEYRKEILNSIPKSKVKEKIEELEKQAEEVKNHYKGTYACLDEYLNAKSKIQGFKELLEEEE